MATAPAAPAGGNSLLGRGNSPSRRRIRRYWEGGYTAGKGEFTIEAKNPPLLGGGIHCWKGGIHHRGEESTAAVARVHYDLRRGSVPIPDGSAMLDCVSHRSSKLGKHQTNKPVYL
eukprot:1176979-Prorocentrum_minimum.AAC.2